MIINYKFILNSELYVPKGVMTKQVEYDFYTRKLRIRFLSTVLRSSPSHKIFRVYVVYHSGVICELLYRSRTLVIPKKNSKLNIDIYELNIDIDSGSSDSLKVIKLIPMILLLFLGFLEEMQQLTPLDPVNLLRQKIENSKQL